MRNGSAVFVLRHYNDIDHMGPVIHETLSGGHAVVRVLLTEDGLSSFRLIERLREMGAQVETLASVAKQTGRSSNALRRLFGRGKLSLDEWLDSLGESYALFADWDYTDFGLRLAHEVQSRSRPAVSLPHGDAPYTNRMINLADVDGRLQNWYRRAEAYDHTVVPNELCAGRYPSLSSGRLHVLGSPRYNRRWLEKMGAFTSRAPIQDDRGRLRIALFLRNRNFPIHWEEVERAIEIVVASGPVSVIVKHHTRDKAMNQLVQEHPRLSVGHHSDQYRVVADEVGSGALLEWADLVIDLGTSVAFEAVLKGIPVLSLEYVHANRGTISEFLPQTDMRCRDDLANALTRLHLGGEWAYEKSDLEKFIDEVVEPGGPDVLERYVRLVVGIGPASVPDASATA